MGVDGRRRCGWRCSGRCGWSSTARRSRCAGPKRRAVLALLALAEGRTVTVDHLRGRAVAGGGCRSRAGRPCTPTSPGCAAHLGPAAARLQTRHDGYRLDARRRRARRDPGAGAAGDGARRRRARPGRGAARCCGRRTRSGAGRCSPTSPTSRRSRPPSQGCARLHREVTDALIAARDRRRAGRRRSSASPPRRVAADPLREPAVLLLMRALAATGQAPEALRIGREYRRRLAEETGLDPSPALGELERDIAGGAAGPPARPRPRRAAPGRRPG